MPIYSHDEWARRQQREEARESACTSAIAGLRRAATCGLLEYAIRAHDAPHSELMNWLPGQGSDGLDGNWNEWRRGVGR